MRDVGAGLGNVKTKFATVWRKEQLQEKQKQQHVEEIQGPAELSAELAAELPAMTDVPGEKQGNTSMERHVDGLPFVFQAPVVKELGGASVVPDK